MHPKQIMGVLIIMKILNTLVLFLLFATAVSAVEASDTTSVGSITIVGDTYQITRSSGGATGELLTFIGTQGRDVPTYPNDSTFAAGAFPQIPETSRIAICGPCPLVATDGSGNMGAYIGIADDGQENNGSIIVSAYEPTGPSVTVQMNLQETDGIPFWQGSVPELGYNVYFGFNQNGLGQFLLKDGKPPLKSYASTGYDSIYKTYWTEALDHQFIISMVPPEFTDGKQPWNPSSPPPTFEVVITMHVLTGVWTSTVPENEPNIIEATEWVNANSAEPPTIQEPVVQDEVDLVNEVEAAVEAPPVSSTTEAETPVQVDDMVEAIPAAQANESIGSSTVTVQSERVEEVVPEILKSNVVKENPFICHAARAFPKNKYSS